ncbi:pyrroline-5-carboxylate reductase [Cytobacillus sp. Hm23]
MLQNEKVAFLGAGSMAEAMISGLIYTKKIPNNHIIVSNQSNMERLRTLEDRYGIRGDTKDDINFSEIDFIVLAMKPKDAESALTFLKNKIKPNQVILSVMAGITTAFIEERLNEGQQVIRVMPNTSSMVRESATGVSTGSNVEMDKVMIVKQILECFGEVYLIEEEKMDLFTGIAGSGPAYFYYLIEQIERAAVDGGIEEETARKISVQTMLGASKMIMERDESPSKLRENVTSPNGTTQAGLDALQKFGGGKAIKQAVKTAAKRSREINKEYL